MTDQDKAITALKAKVLNLVQESRQVTFGELANRLIAFREGTHQIALQRRCVLWSGMAFEACMAIEELRAEGLIHAWPVSPLAYLADGNALADPEGRLWPIARRVRAYDTPHWYPVELRPGPMPGSKDDLLPDPSEIAG